MQREPFTPPDLSDALLARMPLFPLTSTVLFPHGVLPLHFFEPRYRALAEHCVEGPRVMALGTLRDAAAEEGAEADPDPDPVASPDEGPPALERVVTIGAIAGHRRLPDGRWDVALRGLCRAEIVAEVTRDEPFRVFQLRRLRERERPEDSRLAGELRSAAVQLANVVPALWAQLNPQLLEARSPAALADLMAAMFVDDAATRRALVEETRVAVRLERVIESVAQHLLDLTVRSVERGADRGADRLLH